MEVGQDRFARALLAILRAIARSDFVALDLEMSGITTRGGKTSGGGARAGKLSPEEAYREMREAAERYQILQIGIAPVETVFEKEYYLARPYNFDLSPLTVERHIKIDRDFIFSTSSCDFLLQNGFDFGKLFSKGVPYLSRIEELKCRKEQEAWANKKKKQEPVVISATDYTTLDFMRLVRRDILNWLTDPKPEFDFVNIENVDGPLNGYQRRLVYQIVDELSDKDGHPKLQARPRNDSAFMQISLFNEKKEAEFKKKKHLEFEGKLAKQKGMRWIFEALTRGDLSGINPEWLASKTSENPNDQLPAVTRELERIVAALMKKEVILVGHNLFYDLGFLYKTFVGPLPASLAEFQKEIHALFPTIIDTKYLATHKHDDMNTRAKLKDLLEPFEKVHMPRILLHEQHNSYGGAHNKEHEAGYDSWMTAQLFVKFSGKLWSTYSREEFFSATSSPAKSDADSDAVPGGGVLVRPRTPLHGDATRPISPNDVSATAITVESKATRAGEAVFRSDATITLNLKTSLKAAIKQGVEAALQGAAIKQATSRSATPDHFDSPGKSDTGGGAALFTPKAGSKAIPIIRPHPEPSDSLMDMDIDMEGGAPVYSPTRNPNESSRHPASSSTVGPVNTRRHAIPIHRPDPEPAVEPAFEPAKRPALSTHNMYDLLSSYYSDNDTDTTPSPTKSTTLPVHRLFPDAQSFLDNRTTQETTQTSLPPSSHATQLDLTATIQHDNDDEATAAAAEPPVQQWLPDLHDDYFWEQFVNKLRVNAVEGGVIDLAE